MNYELTFEEALKRLEEIIAGLDEKNLDLERAISLYEEGMALIHFCEEKLKQARSRVEVILKSKEGFTLESLERAKEFLKNG